MHFTHSHCYSPSLVSPYFLLSFLKISPGWFLHFCLPTNVITQNQGTAYTRDMLPFSCVWLFTVFLAHLDGLQNPKSNVLSTMCTSVPSMSAFVSPVSRWVLFFPQSLCDSWNEKEDYALLCFAGLK